MINTSSKLDVDCSLLKNYQSIKLNRNIKAGKIAVADLNGDGIYDISFVPQKKMWIPECPVLWMVQLTKLRLI